MKVSGWLQEGADVVVVEGNTNRYTDDVNEEGMRRLRFGTPNC